MAACVLFPHYPKTKEANIRFAADIRPGVGTLLFGSKKMKCKETSIKKEKNNNYTYLSYQSRRERSKALDVPELTV